MPGKSLLPTVSRMALVAFGVAALAGCASTKITSQNPLLIGKLPRPGQILVYNFVATAAEVPADSTMARTFTFDNAEKTPEEIQAGRQLGSDIAGQLAAQIREMGLPARQAVAGAPAKVNDILIRGYLVSFEEGSAAKRVGIGFGKGASELRTAVESFQMTAQGLRKLGSGTLESGGSKTPGAALGVAGFIATANPVGLIVGTGMKIRGEKTGDSKLEGRAEATAKEIAGVLRQRFQEQGWVP